MRKGRLLLLLSVFLLTGCWDKKDPEERTYVITMGVDDAAEGCRVTFAPANIETGEAEAYTAESRTLAGAVADADTKTSRKTELGQLKTIVFGGAFLEESEKLNAFLQELERNWVISEKVMLLATEGSAEECVQAVMKEDGKTGLFLWDFYKNTGKEVAVTKGIDLDVFLTEREERGGCAVLPRISAEDEKPKLGGGAAVTPKGISFLSDQSERGYLFLQGDGEGALLEGRYRGEVLPLTVVRADADYAFIGREADILCRIRIPVEGILQGGRGRLFSAEEQKKMERIFEDIIKSEILHTLKTAEEAEADLYGILPRLHQEAPELAAGADAEELWSRLSFEIRPEVKLRDMGRKR